MNQKTGTSEGRIALAVSALAAAGFTYLLRTGDIGEAAYCFLIAGTAVVGIVLFGFGRLQELDLKSLRVTLREVKEANQELYVEREKLKAIATPLAQIVALVAASEGRLSSAETFKVRRAWFRQKTYQLLDQLDLPEDERAEAAKYVEKYREIDSAFGDRSALKTTDPDYEEVKAKMVRLSDDILGSMKTDLRRAGVEVPSVRAAD
jgi:Sec-independent protein translocase protein TatA